MKKKTSIVLPLLFFVTFHSMAQNNTEGSYSRDIGFNTRFIFEGILNTGSTPFSLMYKKYKSDTRATRFGLDLNANLGSMTDQGSVNYTKRSDVYVRLAIGKEIQNPIGEKWVFYYGGDITPFYNLTQHDQYANDDVTGSQKWQNIGIGLKPFLALRFNINERLYLSTEAGFNLDYTFANQSATYRQNPQSDFERDSHNVRFNVQPAYGIFAFYHF